MSNIARMMQRATAGAGGAGLDVDEVFSTYLYDGTGSAQTITNNIDLSGEGGLVWLKERTSVGGLGWHSLFDTARGTAKYLSSNNTNAEASSSGVTAFNSNGFTLGDTGLVNQNTGDFVSWTFRKAKKFFDVVKYVGNGSTQTISHNLGSVPGMMIVKCLDNGGNWRVFHTSVGNTKGGYLAENLEFDDDVYWNDTTPTSTVFTVGNKSDTNGNGLNYVAYLFAHNNNDGGFGPDSDQDIIKCGTFIDSGSSSTPSDVNLGFEPQFILFKRYDGESDWYLMDVIREMSLNDAKHVRANLSNAETNFSVGYFKPTPTGFQFRGDLFGTNKHILYMAIRRGPLAAPDDATKVFQVELGDVGDGYVSGTPELQGLTLPSGSDMVIGTRTTASANLHSARLTGSAFMSINATTAENSTDFDGFADFTQSMTDIAAGDIGGFNDSNKRGLYWVWKRAPGYFDTVTYTGTGSARTQSHNLGAVPEMMWVKGRDSTDNWSVYHKDLDAGKYLQLNVSDSVATNSNQFTTTDPTASVFSVGTDGAVNGSGSTYIAHLFATVAGVSKVGSFVSDGNPQNIDCGFSSGARFVLIKKSSGTFNWRVWDSVRGIVAGDDPYIFLDTDGASTTNGDWIDPHSSGFSITTAFSNGTYIFYAIA